MTMTLTHEGPRGVTSHGRRPMAASGLALGCALTALSLVRTYADVHKDREALVQVLRIAESITGRWYRSYDVALAVNELQAWIDMAREDCHA